MMKPRALATMSLLTLMGVGVAAPSLLAKPATRPTKEVAVAAALTKPSAEVPKIPSKVAGEAETEAAKAMRELKERNEKKAKQKAVAHFDLSEPLAERPAEFSLLGDHRLNMRSLLDRLEKARGDENVKGVLVTLGDPGVNLSQAMEIRDALASVAKAGKPVFVHADTYDTALYTLASGASDVCVLEGGELMLPGVGIESMFLRGLFDKVGVKADYVQIGEYKGADEEYTRVAASDELRGEMKKLVDGLYEEIVDGIAASRKLNKDVVRQSIDDTMVSAKVAKARGLVDHLVDQDGLRGLLAKKLGGDVALDPDYGAEKRDPIDFSNPLALMSSIMKRTGDKSADSDKPAVAVIYAEGVIVDGETEEGLLGGGGGQIGSENLRQAFRVAARDKNIKAVVVRIDSPGGSALASEVMWQAARRCAEKKPVFISVGGMAASGGYYLASSGETIYADPTAVVGSIGVVGGKFVLKDLFDKLGIKTEKFAKGRNAGLFSMNEPWSDRQRVMVTTWMKQTYDQFTERVMTTRKGKIKDIDLVARGRIFVARQAKELGMVDEIGGLGAAVAGAAKKGGLKAGEYDVRQIPAPKTLGDLLSGNGTDPFAQTAAKLRPTVKIEFDGLFAQLSPDLQRQVRNHILLGQLLQKRPVVLMSPYQVTVK
ncbi:MAG TPA: signal peptide peptidase SppA [Humisphaera sp.]